MSFPTSTNVSWKIHILKYEQCRIKQILSKINYKQIITTVVLLLFTISLTCLNVAGNAIRNAASLEMNNVKSERLFDLVSPTNNRKYKNQP